MKRLLVILSIAAMFMILLPASTVVAQEICYADCNGDLTVNLTDLVIMKQEYFRDDCEPSGNVCSGTLSDLGRWCDQGDGTVKDMTTGLIWLKDAGWGGAKPWREEGDFTHNDDAHTRAGILYAGTSGAGLSDGSVEGDWRLPTKNELVGITMGDEYIRLSQMYFFTNVQVGYWSSTTNASNSRYAWAVGMEYGEVVDDMDKYELFNCVWPVRGGQ